ncbi:MAG: chemotaxis-specific protein-glutamate methyltransferase CheB [Verrucomicrobiota bacterium]
MNRTDLSPSDPAAPRPSQLIRTLIVDDSAFVRKAVREMLSRSPYIDVVGAARDGEEALELAAELKPDIITCDLNMPRLDGVGFVRRQMAIAPVPILILSSSPEDAGQVLEALNAGAVDFIQKPTALATDQLLDVREQLVAKVKAAARAPVANLNHAGVGQLVATAKNLSLKVDLVVLGISTGGPQALRFLLPELPADFPVPIAIVLHMPVGYTAPFAEKLDELCQIDVAEASEGAVLRPGLALIAQAGRHLEIHRNRNGASVAHLTLHPLDRLHRPSVDVLFQSAANAHGKRVLGIVMTGMGDDGKQGAAWIKAQGGTILTEAESSCIIYGMPRSVVEAGLSDASIPLAKMAQAIVEHL